MTAEEQREVEEVEFGHLAEVVISELTRPGAKLTLHSQFPAGTCRSKRQEWTSINLISYLVEVTVASVAGAEECRDQADGEGLPAADNPEDEG